MMSRKQLLSLFAMMLFCGVGFAQDREVMVVRQTNGKEVCYDVTRVEKVYVRTESACVDLGLPSGLKWATCNLGANAPEEAGDCYGWGCAEPYADGEDVDWTLYFSKIGGTGSSQSDCGTAKDPLKDYVYPNNKSISGTRWDAARQKLGGTWRMPTTAEQEELMNTDNCNWQWTTENGVNGYKVTSKKNGNSIFLPAAGIRYGSSRSIAGSNGDYWSSSPNLGSSDNAYYMYIHSYYHDWYDYIRCYGFSVRPVSE